jgi:hypothetical protein
MNLQKRRSYLLRPLPILSLLLLITLFLNKMAFSNLILARGDTFLYFYPYWQAAADALRTGRIPLWNPTIFMGAPLLANSQMGFFYPLNWPVWLLLDTPYAISASILLHLLIAGTGTYMAGRRVMLLDRSAAFLTAVVFALGGYLTAQVEHINQLQGLAWLPWLLLVVGRGQPRNGRNWLGSVFAVAFLFSLQLLAGHTQTAFISGVALVIWILAQQFDRHITGKQKPFAERQRSRDMLVPLSLVLIGGLLALLLAAVQLLPTIELTGLSSRQGGLPTNEVLSFSLHPLLITRTLLPAYRQSLFSEYVAFLPLIVLALAFIGAWQWRKRIGVLPALVWILAGFLLALGAFNPLNWLLAQLPGFNLFRAPARWLVLYALGIALLAGVGWQIFTDELRNRRMSDAPKQSKASLKKVIFKPLLLFLIVILLLAIWGFLAGWLVDFIPTGLEAPYEAPSLRTVLGWGVEIVILLLIYILLSCLSWKGNARLLLGFLLAVVVIALFVSSRTLPYNNLTTPEAFFDLRPPTTRLLADASYPPGRFITLSDIFFDPGDQAEIDTIYQDQLTEAARYDYTIAIKHKEVVAPNLPMLYGLASVDGFDGGILPLRSYSEQMKLVLPEGINTTDGRLREHLDIVPEGRWLDLFNTKFLITDKVGDIWQDGVFFDRQHPVRLEKGEEVTVGYMPDFEATELRLLASQRPGVVKIVTADDQTWEIVPELVEQDLYQARFPEPVVAQEITVAECQNAPFCELLALSLVDDRDGSFHPLVPGDYRMVHSGDVKIYENLDVMPRAYLVTDWQWIQDSQSTFEIMRSPNFDVRSMSLLQPQGGDLPQPEQVKGGSISGLVEITQYLPEQVVIVTDETEDGMLVLTDANYPGWIAKIDGQPTLIFQANNLFRAVFVPAGPHEIVFTFEPRSFETGLLVTLASLVIVPIIWIVLTLPRKKRNV